MRLLIQDLTDGAYSQLRDRNLSTTKIAFTRFYKWFISCASRILYAFVLIYLFIFAPIKDYEVWLGLHSYLNGSYYTISKRTSPMLWLQQRRRVLLKLVFAEYENITQCGEKPRHGVSILASAHARKYVDAQNLSSHVQPTS